MTPYYSNHAHRYRSQRHIQAPPKRIWKPILLIVALLIIAGELTYLSLWSAWSAVTVWGITTTENSRLPLERISAEIELLLTHTHATIIPNNNIVFFPRTLLSNQLRQSYPEIHTVTIQRNLLQRSVTIDLLPRTEIALWCVEPAACYFIDNEFMVFRQAPQTEGVLLTHVTDTSNTPVALGKPLLHGKLITAIIAINDRLDAIGITVTDALVHDPPDITLKTSAGYELYFDTEESLENQVNNLKLILEKELNPMPATLHYIDLRIDNRIYYK